MDFPIHTTKTAQEPAKHILEGIEKGLKFVPNLIGVMAESSALVAGYTTLSRIFDQTSFDATEKQIILLTVSSENGCTYCVAAHTVIAGMQSVPEDVVNAIRDNQPLANPKYEALRQFTQAVVETRGWPDAGQIADFLGAGYEKRHILDVVLGVGVKTLSNYTNHIAQTPLDDAFASAKWHKAD